MNLSKRPVGSLADMKKYVRVRSQPSARFLLMQARLFEHDIYMEHFLTATDGAEGKTRSALFKKI